MRAALALFAKPNEWRKLMLKDGPRLLLDGRRPRIPQGLRKGARLAPCGADRRMKPSSHSLSGWRLARLLWGVSLSVPGILPRTGMCQNETAMSFLLGIDGGGSKSAVAVSDGISVLATHTAGACNLTFVSRDNARLALADAIHGALSSAGISASAVSSVCAGSAGGSFPRGGRNHRCICLPSSFPTPPSGWWETRSLLWKLPFPGVPGVVCISGTGSVAFWPQRTRRIRARRRMGPRGLR